MMVTGTVAIGMAQTGLLMIIAYRQGGIKSTLQNHTDRITALETNGE